MNATTEYRTPQQQREPTTPATDGGLEFAPIPWAEQMRALAAALRVRGHAIPEDATVSLIPIPTHLRNGDGLPLYRVAIVSPDNGDGDQ